MKLEPASASYCPASSGPPSQTATVLRRGRAGCPVDPACFLRPFRFRVLPGARRPRQHQSEVVAGGSIVLSPSSLHLAEHFVLPLKERNSCTAANHLRRRRLRKCERKVRRKRLTAINSDNDNGTIQIAASANGILENLRTPPEDKIGACTLSGIEWQLACYCLASLSGTWKPPW